MCAAREAARSVHANGIIYIRFYRKTARMETVQSGSNLTSKTSASKGLAARDMLDVWDVLICMEKSVSTLSENQKT